MIFVGWQFDYYQFKPYISENFYHAKKKSRRGKSKFSLSRRFLDAGTFVERSRVRLLSG